MAKAPVEVEVDLAVSSAGFAPVSAMFIDGMLEVTVPVAPLRLVVVRHLGSTVPVNSLAGVTVIASLPAPP